MAQHRAISVVSAPADEPISVAEAKLWLRVDAADDDPLIGGLIRAARDYCEQQVRRAFVTQTLRLTLDQFPYAGYFPTTRWSGYDAATRACDLLGIELPRPPLQSVTSIQYVDTAGATQTLAAQNYVVDAASEPGRVTPAVNTAWPTTQTQINSVLVTFVAGYGTPDRLPPAAQQAIGLLVAHWYEHREAAGDPLAPAPFAVDALLNTLRWGSY